MPNLLLPRPGGTLAAIAACPDADVIFVAHAGLDSIVSVGDVWRNFPIDQVIKARWWRVPFDAVPRTATHEAQVQWLYDWWKLIDSWISANSSRMVLAESHPVTCGWLVHKPVDNRGEVRISGLALWVSCGWRKNLK